MKRASGFLPPVYGHDSSNGSRFGIPYYWVIGPDKDATFRPIFTTEGGTVLNGQYRQRFGNGMLTTDNSVTFGSESTNPRTPDELWPDLSEEEKAKLAAYHERMARENPGYRLLGGDDCGRRDLAGKSVAVPFVGTSAASLVVAEAVRVLHDGPAYFGIKLGLGNPGKRLTHRNGNYTAQDAAGLSFVRADQRRIAKN